MLEALIGIGGILLGAGLSALRTLLSGRRAQRESARSAARLILPELIQNERSLSIAITFERWCDVDFDLDRWRLHEATIVESMGDRWPDLAAVYTAFMLMAKDRVIAEAADESKFDGDLVEYMLLTQERAHAAIEDLQSLAGISDPEAIRIPEFYGV